MTEAEWAVLADRFWRRTDIVGACHVWRGSSRFMLHKHEAIEFGRREASPSQIGWWIIHRDRQKFVERSCTTEGCVSHLAIRSKEVLFWRHVDKTSTPDGCWLWTGGQHTFGYGSTTWGSAHKVAYELAYGAVPEGLVVRHKCHIPLCCRPDHLEVGTQKENVDDMHRAGRWKPSRGHRSGLAAFTKEQAVALRAVFSKLEAAHVQLNESIRLLATITGVSPRNVWRLVKGRSYEPDDEGQTSPTSSG